MTSNFVVGIDPGATGALVKLGCNPNSYLIFRFSKMTRRSVAQSIRQWNDCVAGVEHVHIRTDTPESLGSQTQMVVHRGMLEGWLIAADIPYELVEPKTWQFEFNLGGRFEDYNERKRAHKAKAQELFPDIKVTLDLADALLIALYMHRKTFGGLTGGKTDKPKREARGINWAGI